MRIYKLVFAKNHVISCSLVDGDVQLEKNYYYEHISGNLIYAVVKARDENEAASFGKKIVTEVKERVFGNDYLL